MGSLARFRTGAYALAAAVVMFPAGARAADRHVSAGDDLQAVLDAAQPGDVILLESGATFTGNFVLGVKPGSGFITLRSATADELLPPDGWRMTPEYSALLAKIQSPNNVPALRTATAAHHWRIMLLEFPSNRQGYGEIIRVGEGWIEQSTLAQVPYEIEFDRLYIHGHPLYGQKRGIAMNGRAITVRNSWISEIRAKGADTQAIGGWNGPGPVLIENNYLEATGENVLFGGADPAIPGLVTEDIIVRRNYMARPMSWKGAIVPTPQGLSATAASGSLGTGTYSYRVVAQRNVGGGETARSGASAPVSASTSTGGVRISWSAVPDAEEYLVYGRGRFWVVTTTSFTDTGSGGSSGSAPTTPGDEWQVKNLFELKNGRRVVVEYNVIENNWRSAQPGYAVVLTVRNQDGTCTWCVVSDVKFEFNVVRNTAAAINILGYDSPNVSAQTRNISIRHNLFYNVTTALDGNGWFMLIGQEPRDVIVDHNTIDFDGTTALYAYGGTDTSPMRINGFQFTNNALRHREYGINGAYFSTGTTTLEAYFPGALVSGNWMPGGNPARYPAGNSFDGEFESGFVSTADGDYRAAPDGVLKGAATDGTDIGADIGTLSIGISGVIEGRPGSGTGTTLPPPPPPPDPQPEPEPEPEPEPAPPPPPPTPSSPPRRPGPPLKPSGTRTTPTPPTPTGMRVVSGG